MGSLPHGYTRREVVQLLAAGTASVLGCSSLGDEVDGSARLSARPGTPSHELTPGLWTLGLDTTHHDGRLLIPASYVSGTPTPFVLALHGAGGSAVGPIALLTPYAEAYGFVVLAVDSYWSTWNAIRETFGPDVRFIDRALTHAFDRCTVDPARVAIEGFSDGASYASAWGSPTATCSVARSLFPLDSFRARARRGMANLTSGFRMACRIPSCRSTPPVA